MDRRKFLKAGGAAVALSSVPSNSLLASPVITQSFRASTIKNIRDRIKPITEKERQERRLNAQQLMAENKIDALFMEGGTSLEYFSGARWGRSERLFGMLMLKSGDAVFIAPKFEESRAKEQIGNAKLYCWEENESPFALVEKILREMGFLSGTLGIEETTRFFVSDGLQKAMPFLKLCSATSVTAGCRAYKTKHEIELMQIANDITREVYQAAVKHLKAGMKEREFGDIITRLFAEFGVDGGALVLFGEASAHPHGLVKESVLKLGDIVLIDGGCSVEGYESDITRTTVFGKPTQKMNDVFNIVLKAQTEALNIAKPGVTAGQLDAVARKIISDAGYGPEFKYFTHRLGHGIGMDGHEWFYLVGGNQMTLQERHMSSNEPGIYLPGEFGIRIEDELLITENGARHLLPPPKSLEVMF